MSALATPPAPDAPPAPAPSGPPLGPAGFARIRDDVARWLHPSSTPGWYRLVGVSILVTVLTFAVVATAATVLARASSQAVESNVAPSLISVQGLSASVAEANATATAVFLSGATGDEDRTRRVLYLEALQRSARQAEEVAALAGDDGDAHDALQRIAVALTTYSGQIEASRTANRLDQDSADETLRAALDLTDTEIATSIAALTDHNQDQLDADSGRDLALTALAFVIGAVAVGLLAWVQIGAYHRSNRILSIPLVVATGLLVVNLGLLWSGSLTRITALDNAETGGYQAIARTSELQASAYQLQSQLSLTLLGAGGGQDPASLLTAIDAAVEEVGGESDSTRERAAAAELAVRWGRYRAEVESITALATSSPGEAVSRFQGSGLATFNGFNTSIESVLSDNRSQFEDGVAAAASAMSLLPLFSVVLPALAGVAVVLAVQGRLRDYQ